MKKAIVYVFSGTGNTRYAADAIASALGARGFETAVYEAHAPFENIPDPNDFDMALFGYPVHAYNAPLFFLRFVRLLPDAHAMPTYIFKTSGEPFWANHASSRRLIRILGKKGFRFMSERHMLMPYNIFFRYDDALSKQMYLHTKGMAEVLADDAAAGRRQPLGYSPLNVVVSVLLRIQWFGAWLNGPLIHARKKLCNGCGLCAKKCPSENVRMVDGRPRFKSRCTMCMACAYYCPKDAVRPGLLSTFRVNGPYPFKRLARDDSVPDTYVTEKTTGYFKLFWPYYKRTGAEIRAVRERPAKPHDN